MRVGSFLLTSLVWFWDIPPLGSGICHLLGQDYVANLLGQSNHKHNSEDLTPDQISPQNSPQLSVDFYETCL